MWNTKYSPCDKCKRRYEFTGCNGCLVTKLRNEIDSLQYRIRAELEPRIKAEGRAYDSWLAGREEAQNDD
jgi:hypothetical protein